jgi:hypothetical protein
VNPAVIHAMRSKEALLRKAAALQETTAHD